MAIILDKGHEFTQYYAQGIIAGLFYNFTIVKMKGPNKTLRLKQLYHCKEWQIMI